MFAMALTVYGHRVSQPSRSVYLFCRVNKIPFTEKTVELFQGEHKQDAYLAINPLAVVPSIVDDDFKLSEGMAILKYLARRYKVADHWYPEDLKARAKIDQYLDWQHTGIRKESIEAGLILHSLKTTGNPTYVTQLAQSIETIGKTLETIEKVFLGDKKYIASDEISIADICCLNEVMQITWFLRSRTDLLAGHPKLLAWKERVKEQLNPDFDELSEFVVEFTAEKQK
ncbi:glutathione S-transferase theta-1-like [Acanthaster planci]|uniref:Glutathione S-transferase theta-1-like n=1 Tax=Acanthaster planci TaxID=133434 RepID=A0A8B7XZI8_ACAPL|nr:glutathione S-transferase theta-1-like [Acanthaster planci]XP_022085675.1 glutathione S-transferase theta-1-like [Acanthaster planci]XP_022085676.1 glutathione S-transferase theta-1-like [Acanthaster planci]XP_022085677.1 glutathione S-transferase theta-1-like [Acanthaster planci]